jgi:hypothetical protein
MEIGEENEDHSDLSIIFNATSYFWRLFKWQQAI